MIAMVGCLGSKRHVSTSIESLDPIRYQKVETYSYPREEVAVEEPNRKVEHQCSFCGKKLRLRLRTKWGWLRASVLLLLQTAVVPSTFAWYVKYLSDTHGTPASRERGIGTIILVLVWGAASLFCGGFTVGVLITTIARFFGSPRPHNDRVHNLTMSPIRLKELEGGRHEVQTDFSWRSL